MRRHVGYHVTGVCLFTQAAVREVLASQMESIFLGRNTKQPPAEAGGFE
jgi:hypothetical protein